MNREDGFLDAIRESPGDTNLRLTYADWLEEQGDLRAGMIRVEEEMRAVAIHSDQYWELKPQRHAFLDFCDEKCYDIWLRQLGYHRRYQPVFDQVPAEPKYRWRLIREFIERWHGIRLLDGDQDSPAAERCEERVGQPLPESIRLWIGLAEDLGNDFRRVFRDRPSIENMSRYDAVSVMILSEGDVTWGVANENMDAIDPPVGTYSRYRDLGAAQEPSGHVYDSTSAFALSHAASFLGRGVTRPMDPEMLRSLATQHRIHATEFGNLRIYEDENTVLFLHGAGRVGIWENTDESQLHPFFQTLLA